MRDFHYPLVLIQITFLGWSLTTMAGIVNNIDGGVEDIHTLFYSQGGIIGTGSMLTFWPSHITCMEIGSL